MRERYGVPREVVRTIDAPEPALRADGVLIKVAAAGLNSLDWRFTRAVPTLVRLDKGLRAPRDPRLGEDVSGTVLAVGADVTRFAVGDRVFGQATGAFAERVVARARDLARAPQSIPLEDAAALAVAGSTALQALALRPDLGPADSVLVIGATGGVGTYCVQLAAAAGARVTAVCSGSNAEFARQQGAADVIDYTSQPLTGEYDLIIELAVAASLRDTAALLTPGGLLVLSSGDGGRIAGPLPRIAAGAFSRSIRMLSATTTTDSLEQLARLVDEGRLRPVITHRYGLEDAAEAIAHVERGHTRGKLLLVP